MVIAFDFISCSWARILFSVSSRYKSALSLPNSWTSLANQSLARRRGYLELNQEISQVVLKLRNILYFKKSTNENFNLVALKRINKREEKKKKNLDKLENAVESSWVINCLKNLLLFIDVSCCWFGSHKGTLTDLDSTPCIMYIRIVACCLNPVRERDYFRIHIWEEFHTRFMKSVC